MKKIILLLSLMFSLNSFAEFSMRNCMLLPIMDNLEGALGFEIYNEVESAIKEGSWCYYKSNSEILGILDGHRKNLDQYLENKEVLKTIANKVKAGSLIRIQVLSDAKNITVTVRVYAQNGVDIYFKEKTSLPKSDIRKISEIILNWLKIYEKQIPYDGRIIGVLGDQFTVDIGKASFVRIGSAFKIIRPLRKKKHPLLKEVVEWEYETIAEGNIFNISEFQARGKVVNYKIKKKLRSGDWVRVLRTSPTNYVRKEDFPDVEKNQFGKMGVIGLALQVGSGSATNFNGSDTKKISGLKFGVKLEGEVWVTRDIFTGLSLSRRFGSYSQESGTLVNSSNSLAASTFGFTAGYRYLPLKFFYGPRVDGYIGYQKYTYSLDTSTSDGFTETSFSGILLGIKGSMPIIEKIRIRAGFEFIFNGQYEEETIIYGEAESVSSVKATIGTSYEYSSTIDLIANVELLSNKGKFAGSSEMSHKDTIFNFGADFSF